MRKLTKESLFRIVSQKIKIVNPLNVSTEVILKEIQSDLLSELKQYKENKSKR
ncbi:hypothetical protein M9R32_06280 [Paenisporosarcina quisquiliarum]|uniref:Uncharacterized protein n=1 Tax=Paenisporosarcina quisquiliarum TaxID=365346 RepID=A0A9X3LEY0_9BACL|nr:hypothetical protein [Paenisporosarcina quisquiliarum]MCZ8536783.1 hypothetical protein [Paenisporosarcina quisquiliarum]